MLSIGLGMLRPARRAFAAEALAYSAAMTTPLTGARLALVDDVVVGLKSAGVWDKIDWLLLLASETDQGSRVNLRRPAQVATAVNAPTFTADRGWTGNATNAYLDCGQTLQAAGNVFAQNSAHIGFICNQQGSTTNVGAFGNAASDHAGYGLRGDGGAETFRLCDATSDNARATSASKLGYRMASRTASDSKKAYFNGALTGTFTTASTALPNGNIVVLRRNTSYSPERIAAVHSGSGLTDDDAATLHTLLLAYLTAIGAQP